MAGWDWSVSGEDTLPSYRRDVFGRKFGSTGGVTMLPHEGDRQQRRVSFIHMEPLQSVAPECTKHAYATDPQQHFLAQAVSTVSTVQLVRQHSVPIRILGQIRIQKVNGNRVPIG
jgi:hypothetical protein